ncbi:hypothetical protein WSM22_41470 [Cytophagales bacterium WSM2-2]|nr:hypothetical protein WSM22_41470 [Cytophagales bacterium WSM2-2]
MSAAACPFCGCGNSNFQIGILPNYTKAFAGVRYTYSQFKSSSADGSQFSRDYFHSVELWGGYQFGKVQMMTFIPYITTHKVSDDGVVDTKGVGDIVFLTNYKMLTLRHVNPETHRTISNNLYLGGGIKFNSGQSDVDVSNPSFSVGDFSSMPGTGSTDYLINATHNLLSGNNGIVTNVTYRFNSANSQQYKFGNTVYLNIACFHSWNAGLFIIRPSFGLNFVNNNSNRYQGQEIIGSRGYVLSGLAGLNVQRGKIGFSGNGFLPVSQDLFNGQTHFQSRGSFALLFLF